MNTNALTPAHLRLPHLRPADVVMDIKRLGAMHQTRMSFMRRLVRQMSSEQWTISRTHWGLDDEGYGTAIYRVETPTAVFHQLLFADYLPDEERNDRVIAERWDVTMTLCMGEVSDQEIAQMRSQVPLQEAGRANAKMLVLSRGNKSSRNFEYVVDQLSKGDQPDLDVFSRVGYLFRTTAVYGSGKFGLADWQKVKEFCPDLAYPFAAEMLNCYLMRQFSIELAEFLAAKRQPDNAVKMSEQAKRFLGIGNSTGLGMAPYLIKHPLLISSWVEARETALASIVGGVQVSTDCLQSFDQLLAKAKLHFSETEVPNAEQKSRYSTIEQELSELSQWVAEQSKELCLTGWSHLQAHSMSALSVETQELLNSILLEIYPEVELIQIEYPDIDESYRLQADMRLSDLKKLVEDKYDWALAVDFDAPQANHYFWYFSEEKMEPRLGQRGIDDGEEKAMPLVIADRVQACYQSICSFLAKENQAQPIEQNDREIMVADFLLTQPCLRPIIKRMQTMARQTYGEIRVNLADQRMLPLDLLRCKLSFFGVSKFDPKSDRWVRNTMFQGAPTIDELGAESNDNWFMPTTYLPAKGEAFGAANNRALRT